MAPTTAMPRDEPVYPTIDRWIAEGRLVPQAVPATGLALTVAAPA